MYEMQITTMDSFNETYEYGLNESVLEEMRRAKAALELDASCQVYQIVMYTVVVGSLCSFGLVGNMVSFCVFRYDKMKTSTSFLFQGLAIIDSVLLLVSVFIYPLKPFASINMNGFRSVSHLRVSNLHTFALVYLLPVAHTAQTSTIWVTVLVGLNRFIAVCKPYKAPRLCTVNQAKKQLAAVLVSSVLYNIPRFLEARVHTGYENGTVVRTPEHTTLGSNSLFLTIYCNICYMIFLLLMPLLILTILNICLIRTLKELKRKRQEMQSLRQQQDNNVTFVLIIVVIVFTICQVPALVTQICWNVMDDSARDCGGFQFYFSIISNVLVISNSAVNFFIYFLFNTRFRQVLLQCCCHQDYQSVRTTTVPSTMMTNINNHHDKKGMQETLEDHSNVNDKIDKAEKCENGDGQNNTLL